MSKREMICIVCPKGCRLRGDEKNPASVTGNACSRGAAYFESEVTHPTRILTSTVRIEGGVHRRLPVKTSAPIPKELLSEAMELLCGVTAVSPVRCGDVILKDILGTGVDIVATRDL